MRRHRLPPESIDGLLLMHHKHAAHAPGEWLEVAKTAPSSNLVLQHAPEAFNGIEVVAASGGQELEPKSAMPMGQRRGERVCAVDATAIDDQHHLCASGGQGGHELMDILPKPCGIKLRDNLIEDF